MVLSRIRGLSVFISDIRNCQNKEQERLRVDKELGNIRTRFKTEKRKKAEDTDVDTTEQSAIKLRAQQLSQTSNALVVTDQCPVNGTPPVSQLSLVKMPRPSTNMDNNSTDQSLSQENGTLSKVDSQPPSADLLGNISWVSWLLRALQVAVSTLIQIQIWDLKVL